jgi:tetratricopeptide (TPR) repeat protein
MTNDETRARNRRKRPAPPTTPDPVEIAMETAASGTAPGDAALEVLRANAALLREQIGLARNERFRNGMAAIREAALVAVALLLALGLIGFVWNARQAGGLVVQPISTPPDLMARGLDSRAVSSQLLDRLNRLQAQTDSIRAANTYSNNWQGDTSVEIPSTGVSVDELDRWLRKTLGHETLISGEVTRTGESLSMTVRTSANDSRTVVSPNGDLNFLLQGAAEAIYNMTMPYRYGWYLMDHGRRDEGLAVMARIAGSEPPLDRAYATMVMGIDAKNQGDFNQAIKFGRRALEIYPEHAPAANNLALYCDIVGQTECALQTRRQVIRMLRGSARKDLQADRAETIDLRSRGFVASYQGDAARAAGFIESMIGRTEYAGMVRAAPMHQASLLVMAHDLARARKTLQQAGVVSPNQSYELTRMGEHLPVPTADLLMAQDRWVDAVAELRRWETVVIRPEHRAQIPITLWPRLAYARARTGDLAGAQALISATPLDCYLCLRERARIAELAGDRAAADRWSAEARRQGPSLPFAFAERGQMLAARGDLAGAITFYKEAIARGPRWADPQKYWGDALLAQGDAAGAIAKYRAAAERAPKWGALHLAWGRALETQGRRDQAREKYVEAARLDLSVADRAEVVRRLRGRG